MRVIAVGGFAPSLTNFCSELLEALVAAGHEVFAYASEDDPVVRADLAERGVTYQPIALNRAAANPLDDLKTLYQFYKTWRRLQPDIILAYTIKPVAYDLFAARLAGRLKKALAMLVYRRGLQGA